MASIFAFIMQLTYSTMFWYLNLTLEHNIFETDLVFGEYKHVKNILQKKLITDKNIYI